MDATNNSLFSACSSLFRSSSISFILNQFVMSVVVVVKIRRRKCSKTGCFLRSNNIKMWKQSFAVKRSDAVNVT